MTAGDPGRLRNDIEAILRRYHVKFELRTLAQKEVIYDTELPLHTRTDRIANAILSIGKERGDRGRVGREEAEEMTVYPR